METCVSGPEAHRIKLLRIRRGEQRPQHKGCLRRASTSGHSRASLRIRQGRKCGIKTAEPAVLRALARSLHLTAQTRKGGGGGAAGEGGVGLSPTRWSVVARTVAQGWAPPLLFP